MRVKDVFNKKNALLLLFVGRCIIFVLVQNIQSRKIKKREKTSSPNFHCSVLTRLHQNCGTSIMRFRFFPRRFMEKRKPYNLKGLLAVYNMAQVVACCYLITGILSKEFKIIKFWKCHSVDYSTNDKSIDILTYSYHTFLLKLFELIETVFFVLRKKQNQVSKLHVYHHASTAILGYIMVKYTGGNQSYSENRFSQLIALSQQAE